MVRIADLSRDQEIMTYLQTHSYTQAQQQFNLSRMQISRIKQRNSESQPILKPKIEASEKKPKVPKKEELPIEPQMKEKESETEVQMTIDGLRGLKRLATGIGDKLSNKATIEREVKQSLSTSKGFAVFIKNLMNYLESI